MYKNYIKRLIDIVLSACGLLVLAIPMAIISVIVKLDSRGPVFFWQKRVGVHKTTFMMPKFRTMYIDTPANMPTHMLKNPDAFITKAGHFLRKTSLDELPQLFNVLKGDMNLIGPRPALYNQKDLMAERDKYGAGFVRPGITGLAQVMGRDELPIDVKARYDGIYTQHVGPAEDIFCLVRTVGVVLTSDGVVEGGTGVLGHHK